MGRRFAVPESRCAKSCSRVARRMQVGAPGSAVRSAVPRAFSIETPGSPAFVDSEPWTRIVRPAGLLG
eukprot:5382207-Alexandrium_andersonii.AAC.1